MLTHKAAIIGSTYIYILLAAFLLNLSMFRNANPLPPPRLQQLGQTAFFNMSDGVLHSSIAGIDAAVPASNEIKSSKIIEVCYWRLLYRRL